MRQGSARELMVPAAYRTHDKRALRSSSPLGLLLSNRVSQRWLRAFATLQAGIAVI
jgi:hypothetical protein